MLKRPDIHGTTTSGTKLRARSADNSVHTPIKPSGNQPKKLNLRTAYSRGRSIDVDAERLQHQKMEAVGRLASGIAHDFKNLLTVISGNLEMLALDRNGPRETRILVAEAWRVTDLMGQLIANLLAFVRQGKIDCVSTDVGLLATLTTRLVTRILGDGIGIDIDAGTGLNAKINPAQFQTALINLVVNARDAMPTGGRVSIQVKEDTVDTELADEMHVTPGRYVAVSVGDTGTGMPQAVLGRIFDLSYTTKPAHTGLGLTIVQEFAANAGGAVRIRSDVGHGTIVELWIPLEDYAGNPENVIERP